MQLRLSRWELVPLSDRVQENLRIPKIVFPPWCLWLWGPGSKDFRDWERWKGLEDLEKEPVEIEENRALELSPVN